MGSRGLVPLQGRSRRGRSRSPCSFVSFLCRFLFYMSMFFASRACFVMKSLRGST
ncbi:hypothetical protein MBAV_005974 [Candidatus Magnetobacterium bavaricum]|uniref:Uncharacterized protein n=1 Tax=Candidatus Magnetobacterium bavaricum TaxID=29290 RepID=A0A0F3GMD8_9BACT|nr:hypothetical protein MBAV_005974 [Candidatus Magnetobacterium bavaricum]